MKKIILFLLVLTGFAVTGWAQVPQQFNYQTVVRNGVGQLVPNSDVSIIMEIIQGSLDGNVVFTENRSVHTNANGLLSFNVGSGESIADIDWENGPYYLRVQIDPNGGDDYTLETSQQLISVPYALYAHVADSVNHFFFQEKQVLSISNDTIYLTGGSYVKLPAIFDGDYNSLTNKPTIPTNLSQLNNDAGYLTQEVQVLSISNDTIYLTGGSFVKLPAGFDGDYNSLTNKPTIPTQLSQLINDAGYLTQEVQVLSISNDTIFLTGGSFVKLPVGAEVQDLANVVALGNMAGGKQLKDLKDPTDLQDAVTVHYLDSILHVWATDSTDRGSHNVHVVNACDQYTWHGSTYDVNGIYTYAYSNEGGHYSVDTLKLTIRVGTYNNDYATAYGSYNWHGNLYSASGVYTYPYQNTYGCPSVDTLHLTIQAGGGASCTAYRFANDTATVTACGRYNWYGSIIYSSGEYEHSLGNISYRGCDSVVKVNIVILPEFQKDTAVRTTTSISWRGHTYSQQGDYGDTLTAANGCDSIYMLHLMIGGNEGIGAVPGLFSVDNGVQVRFASGNLQLQSSTNYWRFAAHQYDVLNIKCAAPYYPSWSDIFCWATSGYHDVNDSLCIYHKPWNYTSESAPEGSFEYNNNQYGYGPSHFMTDTSLVGTSENYDWGMYHPIINGGNGAGLWRLLTQEEWNYLFNQRHNASHLRSYGRITGIPTENGGTTSVRGYFLMADTWQCPSGITFVANATDEYTNSFSLSDWDTLEASGVVFLPTESTPFYWTSTSGGPGAAYAVALGTTPIVAPYNRSRAYNVRLAQVHSAGVRDCSCTYYDTTIVASGNFSWHGYSYTESGDYMEAIVNNAGCDSIITLSLLIEGTGELPGLFTVDTTGHQVKFSKGNLQYKATSDIWRFSNYQYDYVGEFNKFTAQTYSGWIDLFGWATSGYHDPTDIENRYYHPWEVIYPYNEGFGPSRHMSDWDLVNTSVKYDWGIYNPIANGGNTAGQWRTLTADEWYYIHNGRTNAVNLRGKATVNGVIGLILLPDSWVCPNGLIFDPFGSIDDNTYDVNEWSQLEAAGAVFLPAGGDRYDKAIENIQRVDYINYWSSSSARTYEGGWNNYAKYYDGGYTGEHIKGLGFNVRLVKDN